MTEISNKTINLDGISNNWFERCYMIKGTMHQTLSQTFQQIFHFDIIATISYEILIILPALFRLYQFSLQPRLRAFYTNVHFSIVRFLMFMSFISCLTCAIHLYTSEQPPCIQWKRTGLVVLPTSSSSPNRPLILTFLICSIIWQTDFGFSIARKIVAIILFLMHSIGLVLMGAISISSIISTISLGLWSLILFNFMPQIGTPIFGVLIAIVDIIFGSIASKRKQSLFLIDIQNCFSGIITSITSIYLYMRYAFLRGEFRWTQSSYQVFQNKETGQDDEAKIPFSASADIEDPIKKIIFNDLCDGIICFIAYLIGNFFLKHYLNYELYQ